MPAHDGSSQPCSEELVHALAAPLASAENYLAGVRVHTRSLACRPDIPDDNDFSVLLSMGIHGAISHLERAATIISAHATGKSADPCTPSPAPAHADGARYDTVSLPDHPDNDDCKGGS